MILFSSYNTLHVVSIQEKHKSYRKFMKHLDLMVNVIEKSYSEENI